MQCAIHALLLQCLRLPDMCIYALARQVGTGRLRPVCAVSSCTVCCAQMSGTLSCACICKICWSIHRSCRQGHRRPPCLNPSNALVKHLCLCRTIQPSRNLSSELLQYLQKRENDHVQSDIEKREKHGTILMTTPRLLCAPSTCLPK